MSVLNIRILKIVFWAINFKINSGETIAVIGGTGSGKSTIAKLIPRFYDVSEGQILIGGVDIRNIKQADLHNLIGASRKSMLLSGTIRSNIACNLATAE